MSIPINDGFGSNPAVLKAVEALSLFGGGDLSHGEAARLLAMWAHVDELTAREKVAVLARFPRGCSDVERDLPVPDADDDSSSGPGWPLTGDGGAR